MAHVTNRRSRRSRDRPPGAGSWRIARELGVDYLLTATVRPTRAALTNPAARPEWVPMAGAARDLVPALLVGLPVRPAGELDASR